MKVYKKPSVARYFEDKAAFPAAIAGLAAAFASGVTLGLAASRRDIHSGQYRFLLMQATGASAEG
ncbi:hypothetical protein [Sporomusa sp.]|uniref:hypothetical protein n=1 Tax=Sporomusa sp. TaxID=2078658 RepID=UPI002BA47E33|nr:hypothetical protein [Sporomusa sp.]HWR05454.1 hypothetical protein [Sporomusa sp.]